VARVITEEAKSDEILECDKIEERNVCEAKEFVDDQPQGRFGRLLIMVTSNLVSNLQFCTIPILSDFKTFFF